MASDNQNSGPVGGVVPNPGSSPEVKPVGTSAAGTTPEQTPNAGDGKQTSHLLPIVLTCVFFSIALVLFLVAFFMRDLSQDQRWILSVFFAVFCGLTSGCFSGSFDLKYSTAVGLAVTATGGFGAWFATPFIFPLPPPPVPPPANSPVYVQLSVTNPAGIVDGEFSLKYRRPKIGPAPVSGVQGLATIPDLPTGHETLEVVEFNHPRLEIAPAKVDGVWAFKIIDGNVSIPVNDTFIKPSEPKIDDIKKLIEEAGLTSDDIRKVNATQEAKEKLTLTVKNSAGTDFALWAYDCWWCYKPAEEKLDRVYSKYLDLVRCKDTDNSKKEFKGFGKLKGSSGHFALFICYDKNGRWYRQYIGVYDLYDKANAELVISLNADKDKPYEVDPAPRIWSHAK